MTNRELDLSKYILLLLIIIVFLLFNNKILDRFTVSGIDSISNIDVSNPDSMGCKPFPPRKKCFGGSHNAPKYYYSLKLGPSLRQTSYCRDYFDNPEKCNTYSNYCEYNFFTGDTCTNDMPPPSM